MSEHLTLLDFALAEAPGQSSAARLLRSTLDLLPVTVVITDAGSRIMHTNKAGAAMLAARDPILSLHGHVSAVALKTSKALGTMIAASARNPTNEGCVAMQVPLPCRDGSVAVAHARSLKSGHLGLAHITDGAVALFIARPHRIAPHIDALSCYFELTPAEVRILGEVISGKSRKGTAAALGLADSTVKTHLENIYAKTGTADRSALCRLVRELSWPDAEVCL